MRTFLALILIGGGLVGGGHGQTAAKRWHQGSLKPAESQMNSADGKLDSDDLPQLRADLQRLKVLLNQMRANLAFVQTSQTPLKHQFELEADAWQVIVEQMERRVKRMEQNEGAKP